eukprot:CAMPEP_0119549042 /NCGR_PEP_ID=MMETSP1352-20130426/2828_1 /TAXON_ID=265584 /ORGANISM="Stauroneis constricta, Strain CCMP1120" /LENGTH=344 /DNA_ID=CAMNT_0007594481 /DNA_START=53 /DNA_END=1083 /DNA_ORIENTATION=-
MTSVAKPLATSTHFDISQLPSIVKDGMSAEEEASKRHKTCRFIEEAGRILKLPRVAISTSMVFFHRFYAKHSFNEHDRFEVAVSCIVLAAKTEESRKKLDTVILECHKLKTRAMQHAARGASPALTPSSSSATSTGELDTGGEEFAKLKERVLLLERVILHTIGFELSIDHPYKPLVDLIRRMTDKRQIQYKNPPSDAGSGGNSSNSRSTSQIMKKLMNQMVQHAMTFANDSMHTSLCLQFGPDDIAIACTYLAAQFAKVVPAASTSPKSAASASETWIAILGHPDIETMGSICYQIMDLISERKTADKDAFARIRAQLELLKKDQQQKSGSAVAATPKRSPPP